MPAIGPGAEKPWEKYKAGPWSKYAGPTQGEYLEGAAGGFNRGLAALAGAPVDLATAALNIIPGVDIEEPFGGSESIRRGMGEGFFPEPPDTLSGRLLGRTAEELGAAALPAAGILSAARGLPRAAELGAGMGARLKSAFLDPIRRTPGLAIAGETAATTGAGVGAGISQEVAPGNKTAEMVAQIFGGLTPALLGNMPAALAAKAVNAATKRFSPEAAAREGREAVGKLLSDEITIEAERLLREAEVLRKEIPGFNPSLGEATGSPALIATQRQIESSAAGVDLENVAARRAGSEQAVEQYAARQAPAATEGADFVIDTANRQINDLRAQGDIEASMVAEQRGFAARRLPTADRPGIGETFRGKILEARNTARLKMNALADKLGINTENVTAPYAAWRKQILDKYAPVSVFEDTGKVSDSLRAIRNINPKSLYGLRIAPKGTAPKGKGPQDIVEFLSGSGIRDTGGDLRAMDAGIAHKGRPFVRRLVRDDGVDPDTALASAVEGGYLPEGSTTRDMYGAIDETLRGNRRFSDSDLSEAMDRQQAQYDPADPRFKPPAGTEVTFQDVKALRERVSDELLDEIGSGTPSRKKIRELSRLKKDVDTLINSFADSDVSGRYKEFRKAYFNEYIQPFEAGTVYKVRQRDGRGFYRTTDEKVAEAFWQPGNVTAARQYKTVLGADPEANAALEAVALDSLRNAAVRDGVIQPGLFKTWARRYGSVLDEFPAIRKSVEDIATADQALITRQGAINTRRQAIEDQLLTRELNAYSKAAKTSEQVIDAALRDKRKMGQLVNSLKTKGAPPEALTALQRHVWDKALEGGADDLLGFLAANNDALGRLFSGNHLKSLRQIAAARAMHEQIGAPKGAGFRPVPFADLERSIGQGIPQIGSRVFAFKSGRMQKGYLVLDTLMRGLRGRAQATAEDLFRVALYDPIVARQMAEAVTMGRVAAKTATRLQARYFALAPTVTEDNATKE